MKSLQMQYDMINKELQKIRFEQLWPGFRPYRFALYDPEEACIGGKIFSRPKEFRANTAIFWQGSYTAIWNIEDDKNNTKEQRTASMVHEMFHAFQMERGEMRFADDIEGLAYPKTFDNLYLKSIENRLLAGLIRTAGAARQREELALFCALRENRERLCISKKAARYEYLSETIEGMAEYVELKALQQLDRAQYEERLEQARQELLNQEGVLDIRRSSYASGLLLMTAAEAAGVSAAHTIGEEERSVFELIAGRLADDSAEMLRALVQKNCADQEVRIETVLRRGERHSGVYRIIGYDPMNMFQVGRKIYGSHFWRLWDETKQETVEIDDEAVLICGENGEIHEFYCAQTIK